MCNFKWTFLLLFCVLTTSFSQTKTIEKGTYISTNKSQKIKLNLLEDNKYDLVFYSGEYKIKGDSLLFSQKDKSENAFNVTFNKGKKADKIKVKFVDPSYYSFYIGTQNGNGPINYTRLSDIKSKVDPEWKSLDVEFDLETPAEFLYLVYEKYQEESQISKFAIPKDASEIVIKYELDALVNMNLVGVFDKKNNELKISENGAQNPLVFINAKDVKPEETQNAKSITNEKVLNWSYPGKEPLVSDDFGTDFAVDSNSTYQNSNFNFKFKIADNLKTALSDTKASKSKFLVVGVDTKNPAAKTDFAAFIKGLEEQVSYSMYNGYDPQYDVFNYYLATANDKKWLKTNAITNDPSVIVLNGDGEILATAKSNLLDKKSEFSYYDNFYKSLQVTSAFYGFKKVQTNKKATDADLITAFHNVAITELPYDYNYSTDSTYADEVTYFKNVKVSLDKKEINQLWKKVIEAHQKDTKPNRLLVETILKEIKNQGFYKHFFNEDKVLNDTDFLSIDYLLKHYDAIQQWNVQNEQGENVLAIGNLSAEIANALQQSTYIPQEGVEGTANQDKTNAVYKKMIAAGKGNYDCYRNYFAFLTSESEQKGDDTPLMKEFSAYFDTYLSPEKGNVIQRLDDMYANVGTDYQYMYGDWTSFKDYHSNLANSVAWAVTLKPENASYIKAAIAWSEYSLLITKNNSYYLDTLAQLYYKDGQKNKAIETQQLAVKFISSVFDEQTATEIRETLSKMQNGTY
ncbi:hypothetical protein [Flavobacterium hercynium]|uniref:Uncharacterized protein n=1 Tax=Flavobacterium hercynium TaxID=387094 RepID=A0A226HFN0_9FLAO|nr:hypothetical protein [Flavobacterium hercynium]OXA92914.1 hypothetical protein B0A66_09095 [Flavobacterium hercynium]SMP03199.1 hypothetical protein SAMN06265346_101252 [Flavobacterium hercynium]